MLQTGTIVGDKYRLQEPVGQGGMATIWLAVHTTLDRPLAVKFLEAVGTQSQQLAARFLQEAKLAAGLRHRHVVDIMDFGVYEGQPFMVMEYLEGQSLADRYVEGPPISDFELLEIVAMTLSGLAAVHDAGILHRDVKPENIFLVEDADGIYPKLLDFGVSRGLESGERFTRAGAVVGTPQYMSPEQARGKKDLDGRSDLFSVGSILYEGLTGEVPFDSENAGDVLIMVATEPHVPLDELRPDLPPALIDLVHCGLEKRPDARFSNAREMRDALLLILEGGDPMAGRPSSSAMRPKYTSGAGTGRYRALPTPPEADEPELVIELPPAPVEEPLEIAMLPPPSALPAGLAPEETASKGSTGRWLALALVAVLAAAAGVFYAYDGMAYLQPRPAAHSGAAGEVRPGEAVAESVRTAPDPDEPDHVEVEPPPSDGVPAPEAETVDVPSPPDPPEGAPEGAPEEAP